MMQILTAQMSKAGDSVVSDQEPQKNAPMANPSPYTARKRKATFYRLVFFHLGALLLILSTIIFLRQPHWILTDLYPMYSWILKSLIGAFAGFLGIAALVVGAYIRIETEAVFHLWQKAKKRLTGLYRSKLAAFGASVLSPHLTHNPELSALRSRFLHCKEDLLEAQHQAAATLSHLASTSSINAGQREQLLNEALIRFERDLARILNSFEL